MSTKISRFTLKKHQKLWNYKELTVRQFQYNEKKIYNIKKVIQTNIFLIQNSPFNLLKACKNYQMD